MAKMVVCCECGHARPAEEIDGNLEPFREVCPKCGSERFEVAESEED